MSTSPIPQTIDILSREKGIDPQVIISAIEDAVVTAARKQFKTGEDLRARYNSETGDVELFALMTVVEEVQDQATEISLVDVEGMGVDGARGLCSLREAGSRTLAEDEESCVVFGMPQAAIRLGAAEEVVALPRMPHAILRALATAPTR